MTTCKYAVVGNPISHSKSPQIHAMFAEQTSQDIHYSAILADIDGFGKVADKFFAKGGQGLNVTVPFKRDAFDYASRTTVRATAAKAVNTLILEQDGSITGDNTDGIGLANDILNNLGWEIKAKRLLVLGAGGAVQGILEPLLDLQPQHIVIANRSVDKALRLAKQFSESGYLIGCALDMLEGQEFDVIINGTSTSMYGDHLSLPASLFRGKPNYCYDLMYGAEATPFMQDAKNHGAITADGLGMLVEQAAESFSIWRGVRPDTKAIIGLIRESL